MTITLASKVTSVKQSLPSIPEISTFSDVAAEAQTTLVIIDSGVEDYSVLAAGVLPNIKTVILDPNQDGVTQITKALQAHPHTTSLHIVSHGSPGCLYLGNTQLSLETLDRHSWDLQSWFSLLPNDSIAPSLLLYGCNTAAGDAGAEFLEKLHQFTGAAIAASTTLTGNALLGGDWELQVSVGSTEASLAFQADVLAAYSSILPVGPDGSGYVADSAPFQLIDLVPGAAGVVNIVALSNVDDSSTTLDLGTNTFRFYGQTYTGNDQLFVSSNGLITFGSGNSAFSNTNLTSGLSQASIAPLWDDWVTLRNVVPDDLVLYQFQDLNADGTPDQLVVEWNEVRHFSVSNSTDGSTFQAILQLNTGSVNGDILFNYPDLVLSSSSQDEGASASVGIKAADPSGANLLLISQNNAAGPYVGTSRAIRIFDNDAPTGTATAVLVAGTEDTVYTITATDLLQGFSDVDGDTLSVSGLAATNGSLVDNNNGTYSFTPTADYNGTVNLSYNVIDGNGGSVAATQSFSLVAVNDAPTGTATASLVAGTEDTVHTINATDLLQGFSDVDTTDTLSVLGLTATNGTLVNNNNGTYSFTPTVNFNGTVNLSYNVVDNNGGLVAATQSFSLAAVNDAPSESSAIFKIGSLSATGANAIEHNFITGDDRGGIAISSSQVFYTGDGGTGRFSKTDLSGGSSVGQQYDAILSNLATGDVFTFGNGSTPLSYGGGTITELIGIDGNSGNLTSTRITLSASIATSGMTGIFSGFNRTAIYTNGQVYNIDLPSGTVTNLGAMSEPPMFYTESWARWGVAEYFDNALYLTYAKGFSYPVTTIERMRVPSGETETVATFSNLSDIASFTVSPADNRWYFHYESSGQFRSGDETIGYADASFLLSDLSGGVTELGNPVGSLSDSGTLTFADPDLADVHLVSPTGTPIGSVLGSLTAVKDTDTTGTGTGGQLTWTYSVDAAAVEYLAMGQTKVESFTIDIDDQNGGIITRQIDVTITGTNDAPTGTASAVLANGTEDTVYTITATDLIQGFSDVDTTDTLSVSGLTATNGLLVDNADGTYSFTPTANYNGTVNLNYNVVDGNSGSVAATQSFSLTAVNDAPTSGVLQTQTFAFENPYNGNSFTEDGYIFQYFEDYPSGLGVNNSGMTYIYGTYNSAAGGADGAIYRVDGQNFSLRSFSASTYIYSTSGMSAMNVLGFDNGVQVASSSINYTGTHQTFTFDSSWNSIDEVRFDIGSPEYLFLDNLVVADGDDLTGTVMEQGTPSGNLTNSGVINFNDADTTDVHLVSPTGIPIGSALGSLTAVKDADTTGTGTGGQVTWTYSVDAAAVEYLATGQTKVESFTIDIDDQNGGILTKQVDVTLTGTNDAPTGTASAVLVDGTEDTVYTITATTLLQGLSDVDTTDTLSVSDLSATNGSLVNNNDGTYSFTPDANYNGTVTLNYNVIDGNGGSVAATQSFPIGAVNDAPIGTASAVLVAGTEDTLYTINATELLQGFSDVDTTDTLSVSSLTATNGTLVDNNDGTYSFTPTANYNGTVNLSYNVIDGNGGSVVATQSFSVGAVADVTSVTATTLDGAYNAGEEIAITLTFDEIVNVAGTPQLTLETGSTDAIATYISGDGTNTLTFLYTVGAGETSVDLDYLSTIALSLNGGSIQNASGIDANLALPTPGAANSLGANKNLVIDTTAPAIPAIASFTTDSGIAGDNITNDTTPTFSGTAEADSTVTLTLDGTATATVVADTSGNWTYTPAVLSEGTHTLSAIATDAAGNASETSPVLSLLIDTTAPATPAIPDLTTVSDTGKSNTDNITNDTTPTLNGIAEANSVVDIFSGTTLLGSPIADAAGTWTFTAGALTDGSYTITTQVTDAAGNTSGLSPELPLTIDTTAPIAPTSPDLTTASDLGVSSTDNRTSETKPTFTGAAEANSSVELFAGTQSLGITTTDATGNWSFTVPTALATGSYNITAQATDVAGNTSASSTPLMLSIQTVNPTVSTLNITPNVRDSNVGVISLEFSEAVTNFDLTDLALTHDGVTVSLVGATLTSQDNRSWILELPIEITATEGRYQLSVTTSNITNTSGNALAAGASDSWLVGYTATALLPISFLGGRRGIRVQGTSRSETFRGTFYSDVLKGMGGNDILIAGYSKAQFGIDRLYGGDGDDTLISGNGKDLLYGEGGSDRLLGGNGKDYLDGGSGSDRLLGGNGNDVLVGGIGNDTLSGMSGKDTFVCSTLNEGADIVTDFNGTEDLIDLRGILRQPEFGGNNRFARFTQYVQLQQVGSSTQVQVDTDGNGAGQTFTTVLTLENTVVSAVNSRNFVIA